MFPFDVQRWVWKHAAQSATNAALAPDRAARVAAVDREPTPFDVVYAENKLELRRYEPDERRHAVPVFLTYPLVNEPSILDFRPDRSVVRAFLDRGFEVYLVDWGEPSLLDASLTLDDFVDRYLVNCIDAARERSDAGTVHLHGYSTGVPLAIAYAALYPERVQTLFLQGPPIDAATDGGFFAFKEVFEEHDSERVEDVFGTVPAPFLDLALSARKPVEYAVENPIRIYENFDDAEFVEDHARKLKWTTGGVDLPGATYRDFSRLLAENALLEGELSIDGERVDVGSIDVPVLLILGRDDEFVPRESALPFLDAVASDDTAVIELPVKHVGLSVAPEAHEEGWPAVCDWLAERS